MSYSHAKLKIKVHKRDGYVCRYCKTGMLVKYEAYLKGQKTRKKTGLTVDHVIPLSKGGTWSMENLVTSCRDCNAKKANNIWLPENVGSV